MALVSASDAIPVDVINFSPLECVVFSNNCDDFI